jgi:hypothetical protein
VDLRFAIAEGTANHSLLLCGDLREKNCHLYSPANSIRPECGYGQLGKNPVMSRQAGENRQ